MNPDLQSPEVAERGQNVDFKAQIYCSEYWMYIKPPALILLYSNAYDKYYSLSLMDLNIHKCY